MYFLVWSNVDDDVIKTVVKQELGQKVDCTR